MSEITHFEVVGLFGNRDVSIPISNNALILVGPNGIGKSSIINIFYYFISRQWNRLLAFEFSSLSITISGETLSARRDEISGLSAFKKLSSSLPNTSRFRSYLDHLFDAGLAEQFFSHRDKIPQPERQLFADTLGISTTDVFTFHRAITRRFMATEGEDNLPQPRLGLEQRLTRLLPSRTLYLPTFRRIEKDIRDIFPDLEARYRSYMGEDVEFSSGRSAPHYIELVSFGMEDVKTNISDKMSDIRNYSLTQYNGLSGKYLRDVIHDKADKYSTSDINQLDPDAINAILSRVSENALSNDDKELLKAKIQSIQGKTKRQVAANDRYLAHYFSRLVDTSEDIGRRERDVVGFVRVCNAYLRPAKYIAYDEQAFTVTIHERAGRPIDMSVLSSGEKQIVSIFAHLYLEDVPNQVVVIDEPELSLSVPWQKRFLTDIQQSGRCGFLLAVTHSPFIYENDLRPCAKDLRKLTIVHEVPEQ